MKNFSHYKKIKSDETGAALILVLIVISLIMFFSTVIANSILSQAKQNQVVETDYRAVHLAEAGAKFARLKTADFVTENDFNSDREQLFFNDLFENVSNHAEGYIIDHENPERTFTISKDPRKNQSYEMTESGATVFYEITGMDDDKEKELYITLSVRFADSGGVGSGDDWEDGSDSFPDAPSDPDCIDNVANCPSGDSVYVGEEGAELKNSRDVITGDFYSDGQINVQNNTYLTVLGTGVFNGMNFNANSSTRVLIRDHAYFNDELTLYNNKHGEFLACGSARFKQGLNFGGEFGVRQHLVADEPVNFDKIKVSIGEDAIFKEGLFFGHHHGLLQVGGDVTIHVDNDPQAYFNRHISGNLKLVGDLVINGEEFETSYGDLKIDQLDNPIFAGSCDGYPLPDTTGGGGEGDPGADLIDGEY